MAGDEEGYIYSRYANPTVRMFEERLAQIEGAEDCRATASGMAAIHTMLVSPIKPGERIVVLVLPPLVWIRWGETAYLIVAETFAPAAECLLFWLLFCREVPPPPASGTLRDLAAIVIANLASFLVGASLYEMNPAYPFWMGSALVIISAVLVFLFIREPKTFEAGEAQPSLLQSVRELLADPDRSAVRLLAAILFWFVGYSAVEAFFNLYATNHLGLSEANGAPPSVNGREPLPLCGVETGTAYDPFDVEGRQCFWDGLRAGSPVEFVTVHPDTEGLLTTTIYRYPGIGGVEILHDDEVGWWQTFSGVRPAREDGRIFDLDGLTDRQPIP